MCLPSAAKEGMCFLLGVNSSVFLLLPHFLKPLGSLKVSWDKHVYVEERGKEVQI
jgi:hypothetical protein